MTTAARPYRQPVPRFWWAGRRSYLLFMLREISSVFVAWFVVFLLALVHAIGAGPEPTGASWTSAPSRVWLR
ncbi:Fumarate reductase subunit C [Mycobacterium talmoniae]|uniref:Fumarate reductase subunit C n=1 Tax=Mycobacterium talmoniae TaxID=1858794 RepID=A0A2S8BFZ9_9MYCO|nr:Fumarate reductase subunit C [Mycobacterium talmoniae]